MVANIHLAEMDNDAGDSAGAIRRLEALETPNADPELFAKLSAFHRVAGNTKSAEAYLKKAHAQYEALLAVYPEAWADHGTEFYLDVGQNPEKAYALASLNFAGRQTERSRALLIEAGLAAGRLDEVCALSEGVISDRIRSLKLRKHIRSQRRPAPSPDTYPTSLKFDTRSL